VRFAVSTGWRIQAALVGAAAPTSRSSEKTRCPWPPSRRRDLLEAPAPEPTYDYVGADPLLVTAGVCGAWGHGAGWMPMGICISQAEGMT
jgi:hypothetical protein